MKTGQSLSVEGRGYRLEPDAQGPFGELRFRAFRGETFVGHVTLGNAGATFRLRLGNGIHQSVFRTRAQLEYRRLRRGADPLIVFLHESHRKFVHDAGKLRDAVGQSASRPARP